MFLVYVSSLNLGLSPRPHVCLRMGSCWSQHHTPCPWSPDSRPQSPPAGTRSHPPTHDKRLQPAFPRQPVFPCIRPHEQLLPQYFLLHSSEAPWTKKSKNKLMFSSPKHLAVLMTAKWKQVTQPDADESPSLRAALPCHSQCRRAAPVTAPSYDTHPTRYAVSLCKDADRSLCSTPLLTPASRLTLTLRSAHRPRVPANPLWPAARPHLVSCPHLLSGSVPTGFPPVPQVDPTPLTPTLRLVSGTFPTRLTPQHPCFSALGRPPFTSSPAWVLLGTQPRWASPLEMSLGGVAPRVQRQLHKPKDNVNVFIIATRAHA